METVDQEFTLSIQVGVRPLILSDAVLINSLGITKNKFQVTLQEPKRMNLKLNKKTIITVVVLILLVWLGAESYTTVKAGHAKVATLFGEIRPEPLDEGFHLVNPLLKFHTYDLRVHTETWSKVQVPSQDKLKTSMDISVTFRINPAHTPTMLKETGTLSDVVVKLVTPQGSLLIKRGREKRSKNLRTFILIIFNGSYKYLWKMA